MTGLVQTSSQATRSCSSSPLFVSRDSFSHQTWARFQRSIACHTYAVRVSILWLLRLGWLLVCCLYKEVYLQIFKRVSFWLHSCCREWEGSVCKPVNHTSSVVVVSPTDRQKSVRNRCLIEPFCGVVCVVTLPFWHFCCRGFCHRTESDLFLFSPQQVSPPS